MRPIKLIFMHDELEAIIGNTNILAMWRSYERNIADPTVWRIWTPSDRTSIIFFLCIWQINLWLITSSRAQTQPLPVHYPIYEITATLQSGQAI
jgi:hypothetical protein